MNVQSPLKAVDPFAFTTGPRDAKVIIVGEAWGSEEAAAKLPFIGASGKELDRMLGEAGLPRSSVLCTNVIDARPAGNDFTEFLLGSKDKSSVFRGINARPELLAGIAKLHALVDAVQPELVIAAGNWPLFALSDYADVKTSKGFKLPGGITKWRGSQLRTFPIGESGRAIPLLPIVHPASILREWGFRAVTVHDLRARGARFVNGKTSWDPPNHTFLVKPKFSDVADFLQRLKRQLSSGPLDLSVDLETYKRKWVSVIGLADATVAAPIPLFFVDRSNAATERTVNYWTPGEEFWIVQSLREILEHPNVRILGQNFIYDTQWFHRVWGINAQVNFDTMVAHHLCYPGTPKALDYLASLYCDHYVYWKDESGDWDQFPEDAERYWTYNAKDIRATYEITGVLRSVIRAEGQELQYADRISQWKLARRMMLKGINFDQKRQGQMRMELFERANELQEWLLHVVPASWQYSSSGKPWYDSNQATAGVLYNLLGLEQQMHKKTKELTVDAEALAALRAKPINSWVSPLLQKLEDLRSMRVFISHFLEARTGPAGRMYCTFNIAHPETFRWSSSSNGFGEGTNLQNIPK